MSEKLTDEFRKTPRELSGRVEASDGFGSRKAINELPGIPIAQPKRELNDDDDYGTPFPGRDDRGEDDVFSQSHSSDKELARFQDRLRRGKVKLCKGCGGVMAKSSRRILSAPSGMVLIGLGGILMVLYGLATNFYQTPWYIKFALPAAYYIGSIFVAAGGLFFFIRERVWTCPQCKNVDKR